MGHEKDRQIEQDEQGWGYRDDTNVCFRCLSDPYLQQMAKENASGFECTFCGRTSRKAPNSIPFNDLMEVIGGAIFQYYGHADEEGMGWDSEDQEYFGAHYDTTELLRDEIGEPSENEDLISAIIDSLGDYTWCDKSPYSLTGAERYQSGWEDFCKTVKHEIRYFFDSSEEDDKYSETIPVAQMLEELRDIIDEAGLIGTLAPGTLLHRVRPHKATETCDGWQSLGSPPPEVSVSNRMSAAGISVFYAAMDIATARAEITANLLPTDRRRLTCATWTSSRVLHVLDLTKLPEAPSFYAQVRYERDHLIFLEQFVESITKPVVHDGREHTEYVPSQIVTEYFRHRYRLPDKSFLDGIIYPSAQHKRGKSIVVFASQHDLNPSRFEEWTDKRVPILVIDPASISRLRRSRRKSPLPES